MNKNQIKESKEIKNLPKYMISTYCSYGSGEVYFANKVSDIVQFIIDYVIYPTSVYKKENFTVNDIPTVQIIEKKIEEFRNNENENENTSFGPKEIIVYSVMSNFGMNTTEYYVTVKILEDVEVLKYDNLENNKSYKWILQHIKDKEK